MCFIFKICEVLYVQVLELLLYVLHTHLDIIGLGNLLQIKRHGYIIPKSL